MRTRTVLTTIILGALAAGCQQSGVSTAEMERLATDRARELLSLPASTPLEARVWTGREHEGDLVMCGTVSGTGGAQVQPQRFAATTSPVQWLVFEDAHAPMIASRPDKFLEWGQLCSNTQAA